MLIAIHQMTLIKQYNLIIILKLTTLILIITYSIYTSAQTDTLKNDVYGGFIILPIEFPIIDNQEINNELYAFGYPKCNYYTANIGIGFQTYANRWIATLSFNKATKKSNEENYSTEIEYRSTSFNLGYDITKNHRYSIYPYAGFKGCGLNYYYREKFSSMTSFNNYLNNNLEYKEITNSRANLDLGFGISFQWFFLVNFRAGYLLPLEKARWSINNNKDNLINSPTLNYDYYFIFTIGVGNIFSDEEYRRHSNR